jgi:chromate transport protein ChrA
MYGLSLGVSRIGDSLPPPVYALLSGLNAATVGIIALAAVQLAEKAITDKVTRALVMFSGIAGMLYTALWFFPVLMLFSGIVTVVWDFKFLHRLFRPLERRRRAQSGGNAEEEAGESENRMEILRDQAVTDIGAEEDRRTMPVRRVAVAEGGVTDSTVLGNPPVDGDHTNEFNETSSRTSARIVPQSIQLKLVTWKVGICVIAAFLASFTTIMIIRGLLKSPPRGVSLFGNLYLAGTIIFGGGPVVIPLLREYIVAEGWVSPRDFLLGLALIQSFPGPNFNFAVYLGSLATAGTSLPSALGALIGFLGIFTPGIIIVIGVMGLWNVLRSRRWLLCFLRGVNAGAVGLVFTAVYKLWQIGFVDADHQSGGPLGRDPWWVSITVISFVAGRWFGLSAPFAILLGGSLGTAWYGVVKA